MAVIRCRIDVVVVSVGRSPHELDDLLLVRQAAVTMIGRQVQPDRHRTYDRRSPSPQDSHRDQALEREAPAAAP